MATDKQVSARLWKNYGITLSEYEVMLEAQGFTCAICHRPPTNKRLHVDHCHVFVRKKITTTRLASKSWFASTDLKLFPYFEAEGKTKSEAIKAVKHQLRRASVRGLLCWADNTALQKYRDDPDRMEAAAKYIRKFNQKQGDSNGK